MSDPADNFTQVLESAKDLLRPVDRSSIPDWAYGNVTIPENSVYTITGKFDATITRHWIGPLEALGNDYVSRVLIMAPPRSGKNIVADVWLPWVVSNDPGPMQWICSTDQIAKDYKQDRIEPLLASSSTRTLLPESMLQTDKRSRSAKDTNRKTTFRNGMVFYIHGPSDSNLQTKGIRYQVRDELWLWEEKYKEADARLADFEELEIAKALTISQGGEEGDSLDAEWLESTQNEWHVQCQKCGEYFVPRTTGNREDGSRYGFMWDEEARDRFGDWIVRDVLESVRYESPCCGHPHFDSPKLKGEWNRTGKYVPMNPNADPRKEGFHIFATICRKWETIVSNLVNAHNARRRGDLTALKKFIQKEEARSWSERNAAESRRIHIYKPSEKWEAEEARFATVDVQAEHFWYMACAWNAEEVRRLTYRKLFSYGEIELANQELGIQPWQCGIDAGYHAKGSTGVYAACCDYGWIPYKGTDREHFGHPIKQRGRVVGHIQRSYASPILVDAERGRGTHENTTQLIQYSDPSLCTALNTLLSTGRWKEPEESEKTDHSLEEEYRVQMASTVLKGFRNKSTGKTTMKWVTIDTNNHAWDCAKLQCLFGILNDLMPDVNGDGQTPEPTE